ncbi:alpha-methylacyl-CoA racemase [Toxorhynchites rutilus septentrionalis]|uniref:alpha-methylacyl-CoA racemase n=1 Tax=Toxorhynchites rutilus septentrionalis TaxID=329112 RepID=UPI00247A2E2E|nr:alpha-methylacyl-CoA racemase [Toxorhynchites rutilus septentrionalis]
MALKGLKVIEFVGLAPGPFCGMLLADFGATVTRIDKTPANSLDVLQAGKRSIAFDLKKPEAVEIVRSMCHQSDVVIEPFRPGVMEKLGLGPSDVMTENPRLIYARLTGFGQYGSHALRAGHDINYLAVSGVLSMFGRKFERPTPPTNFAADFAGGGLLCAFGILVAVLERHHSGKGQIIDHAMVDGAAYAASWLFRSRKLPIWGKPRGENVLDTGAHFYDTFQTKDGKFMSIGAIEPQFYRKLLEGLDLPLDISQYGDDLKNRHLLEAIFLTKTQAEWSQIFENEDACVFPVLEIDEAHQYPHNRERNVFLERNQAGEDEIIPAPAPKLSRTPARSGTLVPARDEFQLAEEILGEVGLTSEDVKKLYEKEVVLFTTRPKL